MAMAVRSLSIPWTHSSRLIFTLTPMGVVSPFFFLLRLFLSLSFYSERVGRQTKRYTPYFGSCLRPIIADAWVQKKKKGMAAVGGGGDACAISFNELVQSHRLQLRKEFFFPYLLFHCLCRWLVYIKSLWLSLC